MGHTGALASAIAALALGQVRGELARAALHSMVTAYARESDITTRRSMLLNIVESAGGDASTVLACLPESTELVRQDIQDYQEILRTGETRIAEIWNKKLARIGRREAMWRVRAGAEVARRAADGGRPSSEPGGWRSRAAAWGTRWPWPPSHHEVRGRGMVLWALAA